MHKEIDNIIRAAKAQGFTEKKRKNNHVTLFAPDGSPATTLPSTPSDYRSLKNCLAALKRHGYVHYK